jgi:hydroxyisourate hydrolase
MGRSPITTHVLDTTRGRPAKDVPVTLATVSVADGSSWTVSGVTDADGRIADLLPVTHDLQPGVYVITFECEEYFRRTAAAYGVSGFYPKVSIHFEVKADQVKEHYHIPLLLNPYGYSTYRGS